MLGRVATGLMLRRWALAAAGVGLVTMIAIATAPKPHCKAAAATPPVLVEPMPAITLGPPTPYSTCGPDAPVLQGRATSEVIRYEVDCAKLFETPVRNAYLALMFARSLDVDGTYQQEIDEELAFVTPNAIAIFFALEDYDNAAAAELVLNSLMR